MQISSKVFITSSYKLTNKVIRMKSRQFFNPIHSPEDPLVNTTTAC